jgi:putative DNA primase/helicase
VDHVLIAEGKQGVYKSTAMELLFGKKWHCGEMPDLGSKDSFIQLPGKWVIELQELEVFSKVESQRAKSFFTASVDRYRASYGRHAVDWPRQCVFYGTTNDDQYLRDETGNRRYWPFHTGFIDRDAIARDRDQIWAEAREAYRGGAQWWPDSLSDKEMCSDEQAKRQRRDEWEGLISHHIDVKNPVWISVKSILSDVLSIEPGKWSRQDQMRVAHCLVSLGWTRKIVSAEFHPGPNKKRFWAYVKGDEECHGISATQ